MDSADFLGLPPRVAKPRQVGITHVMDKGLGLNEIRSMVEMGGDYIDIVKLGWGTSYVTGKLREKLDLYNELGYFERGTASLATLLIEKGILDKDELEARMAAIAERMAEEGR